MAERNSGRNVVNMLLKVAGYSYGWREDAVNVKSGLPYCWEVSSPQS